MSLKVKWSTPLASLRNVSPVVAYEVCTPLDPTAFPPSQLRASIVSPFVMLIRPIQTALSWNESVLGTRPLLCLLSAALKGSLQEVQMPFVVLINTIDLQGFSIRRWHTKKIHLMGLLREHSCVLGQNAAQNVIYSL